MFTDIQIKSLKPKDKPYQVREGKGFGIRVFPSGEKTFFFAYKFHGRQRMLTLASYPELKLADARKKFRAARELLAKGTDPLEAKHVERLEPTVADLVKDFLKRHVAEKASRSLPEYRRNLEKDVLLLWKNRRVKDIKKRDVILLLEKIVDRGARNQANQVFKIVRKMFNFAVERDILEYSPCAGVKLPSQEKKKSRFFSDKEICTFWQELDSAAISEPTKRALRLVLVTGQRPGEIIGLHRSEIDGQWWTIPVERSKNRRENRVFLTPLALELIGDKEDYIFESPRKEKPIAVNALAHAVRNNSSWAQKPKKKKTRQEKGKFLFSIEEPWTPHDLRRTCATHLQELGFSDEIMDAVLNHAKKGVTGIYGRYKYDREKQLALEAWSRKIQRLLEGKEAGKVISLVKKD